MNKKTSFYTCFILVLMLLFAAKTQAQSPEKISFQAVIRNHTNNLVPNQTIGMRISIIQHQEEGNVVYEETHQPQTNANGLVSIEIGTGSSAQQFQNIDWSNGPYFIKTETDPEGQNNYTIVGITQLLSVPYALHAKSADSFTGNLMETDPVFASWDKSSGIEISENQITDLQNYLTLETDPLYVASPASQITQENIDTWNANTPGLWNTNAAGIHYNSGNIGVGTVNPTEQLHINGGNLLVAGAIGQGPELTASGAGSRMFFNPNRGIFRAGSVSGTQWNNSNCGLNSIALGENNIAQGINSISIGTNSSALGMYSIAIGQANSTGFFSVAIGSFARASGYEAMALGADSEAIGSRSTTMGYKTAALNTNSTAMGFLTRAYGLNSIAAGEDTRATGNNSLAMGVGTSARAHASLTIGRYNDTTGVTSQNSWVETDPIFTIGNGTNHHARSNNVVFLKNGSAFFMGTQSLDGSNFPTKIIWDAPKGVFRAGRTDNNEWSEASCGYNSFAAGQNTTASGPHSTAFGYSTTASNMHSTAFGSASEASGIGAFTSGQNTIARSYYSFVIGRNNITSNGYNMAEWIDSDPLFVIGNGTNTNNRSNALTLLKNGTVTFHGNQIIAGVSYPTKLFWVSDKAAFRNGRVTGTQWDAANVGIMSFSSGLNNLSSGAYSFSAGQNATASGAYSFSAGFSPTASGIYAVSIGNSSNASQSNAVALGGYAKATGEASYALGYSAEASGMYSIAIGSQAKATGTRAVAIHLSADLAPEVGANAFRISGASSIGGNLPWTNHSDRRLKKDIVYLNNGTNLDKIMLLRAAKYRHIDNDELPYLGFIAQEVMKVIPEAVRYDKQNDIYSMEYTAIIPILVEGMKEQQDLIKKQQEQIDRLMEMVEKLTDK